MSCHILGFLSLFSFTLILIQGQVWKTVAKSVASTDNTLPPRGERNEVQSFSEASPSQKVKDASAPGASLSYSHTGRMNQSPRGVQDAANKGLPLGKGVGDIEYL